ncbi:MAG: hypothetical protein ACTIJJ_08735 [Galactobacter sp.]
MTSDPLTSTWLYAVAGVLILVAVCAAVMFWLTHRRRKRTVSAEMGRLGDQPLLRSTDKPGWGTRRKFSDEFQVGTEVPVTVPAQGGGLEQVTMRVSRLSKARGSVHGKTGVVIQAYLEQFEGVELPITLPISGDRGAVMLRLSQEGITARSRDEREVWQTSWKSLRFVNSLPTDADPRLVLRSEDFSELHIDPRRGAGDYAEGLVCKYGRLALPNTWDREPGTLGVPATPTETTTISESAETDEDAPSDAEETQPQG